MPRHVSLGAHGAFILLSQGGGGNWALLGQNEELNAFLTNEQSLADIAVRSPSGSIVQSFIRRFKLTHVVY